MQQAANEKLLFAALSEYGRTEQPGAKSDGVILSWIRRYFPGWLDDSTLSWCGLFMAEIAERVCTEIPQNPAIARNWYAIGEKVKDEPMPGDVAVFWRGSPNSWKGHVGLFCRWEENKIYVLGGNQSNRVNIQAYPDSQLIGFRRLSIIEDENENLLG